MHVALQPPSTWDLVWWECAMESAEPHAAGYHRAVFVIEAAIQGFLAVFDISDISFRASIMASATPISFCTTQKHLAVKRAMSSKA
jgi:hypothetical protein